MNQDEFIAAVAEARDKSPAGIGAIIMSTIDKRMPALIANLTRNNALLTRLKARGAMQG